MDKKKVLMDHIDDQRKDIIKNRNTMHTLDREIISVQKERINANDLLNEVEDKIREFEHRKRNDEAMLEKEKDVNNEK
jgi:hypothetical protein